MIHQCSKLTVSFSTQFEAVQDFHPVAHVEDFQGGISFSGKWWGFIFGVRCL